MKSRKLGRGLDSLLQRSRGADSGSSEAVSEAGKSSTIGRSERQRKSVVEGGTERIIDLELGKIDPNPFQPRLTYDKRELESLKASVAKEGLLQPVLVRRRGSRFQLVAGERRFRAAQELSLESIPAMVNDVSDEKLLELALVENIHREDLNPVDTAKAFKELLKRPGWTQELLAKNLGIGRPTVANTLRLLELPQKIQQALARDQIQMGHAKVLLSISERRTQGKLFDKIAEERWSVRDLELARDEATRAGGPKTRKKRRAAPSSKSPNLLELESELSQALATKVIITEKKGRGSIRIEFYSTDDFEGIRQLLLAPRKKA